MAKSICRRVCAGLAVAALLLCAAAPAPARHGHGYRGYGGYRGGHSHSWGGFRGGFGIWLGSVWNPWYWGPSWGVAPWYGQYGYPYGYRYQYPYRYPYPERYNAPPPVVAQPPSAYDDQAGERPSSWYYCEDPQGYYPYVRQCPRGWTKVPSSPEAAPAPVPPPPPLEQLRPGPGLDPPPAEQSQPSAAPERPPLPEEYRWYYCKDPPGYYPFVRDCPGGWTPVRPEPAPAR